MDDLWSLLYMLAEMRGTLPWHAGQTKDEIMEIKKATEPDMMLENSPVQLVEIAKYLANLNYYSRPDYALIYNHLQQVMVCGRFKWTDPYDWETKGGMLSTMLSREKLETVTTQPSKESTFGSAEAMTMPLSVPDPATGSATPRSKESRVDPENPFPAEAFSFNPIGF